MQLTYQICLHLRGDQAVPAVDDKVAGFRPIRAKLLSHRSFILVLKRMSVVAGK